MKKPHLILFVATISIFTSCTKGGEFDLNLDDFIFNIDIRYTLRNDFDTVGLEYMKIPIGRTFQYRDSASNQLFAVKTTKSDTTAVKVTSTSNNNLFADLYILELRQLTNLSSGPVWYSGESHCDTSQFSLLDLYDADFELSNSVNKIPSFWYPFNSSSQHDYNYLVNYTIEGKTYPVVHLFHASNGLPITDPAFIESWYYWVKGIGIAERRIKMGTSIKTEFLVKYF